MEKEQPELLKDEKPKYYHEIPGKRSHSVIEPGKRIIMSEFHQISGHTGEHLLGPTAKYKKIELTGKLAPCEVCAQARIWQANISKKK